MRGISRTFAATVLALGMGIAVAAPALATEEEYLSDLRADDWLGGDAQLLNWGYRACTDLNNGIFRGTIVHKRVGRHRRVHHDGRRQLPGRVRRDVPVLTAL